MLQKYILCVFIQDVSISKHRRSIILVPSCFSRQDASNDTLNDPNGPILQFSPGHSQAPHIVMDQLTPPKHILIFPGQVKQKMWLFREDQVFGE